VLALGVLGAAVLLAAASATAGKVINVKSKVTISSGEGTEFTGTVTAGNRKCKAGRTVKLVKQPYLPSETDRVVGIARTNGAGNWQMRGSFMAGIYHPRVTSSTVHTASAVFHCLGDMGVSARF
jgi:hypothetical protein